MIIDINFCVKNTQRYIKTKQGRKIDTITNLDLARILEYAYKPLHYLDEPYFKPIRRFIKDTKLPIAEIISTALNKQDLNQIADKITMEYKHYLDREGVGFKTYAAQRRGGVSFIDTEQYKNNFFVTIKTTHD